MNRFVHDLGDSKSKYHLWRLIVTICLVTASYKGSNLCHKTEQDT